MKFNPHLNAEAALTARLDCIIELLEGIAQEFSYFQVWARDTQSYPRQVQEVGKTR